MENPFWAGNAPPPRPDRYPQIVRCPVRTPLDGWVLGDFLYAVQTHYDGRTVPCELPLCPYCRGGFRRDVQSFVAFWGVQTGGPCILAVTEHASGELLQLACRENTLRGLKIRLQRRKPAPNGAVYVSLLGNDSTNGRLAAGWDVRPQIAHLFERANAARISSRTIGVSGGETFNIDDQADDQTEGGAQ